MNSKEFDHIDNSDKNDKDGKSRTLKIFIDEC